MDYSAAYLEYSRGYAEAFNDYVSEQFNYKLGLTFETLTSPKYYNFETDRLFCLIPLESAKWLYDLAWGTPLTLEAVIKKRFTSYDGFISSYSNDLDDWRKPVEEYDHNELGTLLLACMSLLMDEDDIRDLDWRVYEAWEPSSNGLLDQYLSAGMGEKAEAAYSHAYAKYREQERRANR